MNLALVLPSSEVPIPATMMPDVLVSEANYSLHRAPYSAVSVLAGDGLPVAQPLTIEGMTYHITPQAAESWLQTFSNAVNLATGLRLGDEVIPIHTADLVALPVGLPRVLKVTLRVYPNAV